MKYKRCILGTCCLPWNEDFSLDEAAFIREIEFLVRNGTTNLYIFGTAGEGYAVSDTQFREISKLFTEKMRSLGAEPMIGVISLSLNTIIERIEYSRDLGVDEVQISLPAWGACTGTEIRRFFAETCGRFPDVQFLHYNVARSKRQLTPDEYGELSALYPNLVASKSGNDSAMHLYDLFTKAPDMRHFLTEFAFGSAGMAGYDAGLLISFTTINWNKAKEFYSACVAGNQRLIAHFFKELSGIRDGLSQAMNPGSHIDGAYDKLFCKFDDISFPLRLLPPYSGSENDVFEEFRLFLQENYPDWISGQ
ncbi:MAG: dihydrodipicolinate synthase family protein [Spirochaetales bacterium]|jgi:dihydrodipicolinate synthase/N-acetylneuraminate lyase|nr:dihydrodipicolinate synthase family protein [Spirochaetales bacterium]